MNLLKFLFGWIAWHVRASFWYLTLGFRLYFAVGLDKDFNPDGDQDMSQYFKYKREKSYLNYLNR